MMELARLEQLDQSLAAIESQLGGDAPKAISFVYYYERYGTIFTTPEDGLKLGIRLARAAVRAEQTCEPQFLKPDEPEIPPRASASSLICHIEPVYIEIASWSKFQRLCSSRNRFRNRSVIFFAALSALMGVVAGVFALAVVGAVTVCRWII